MLIGLLWCVAEGTSLVPSWLNFDGLVGKEGSLVFALQFVLFDDDGIVHSLSFSVRHGNAHFNRWYFRVYVKVGKRVFGTNGRFKNVAGVIRCTFHERAHKLFEFIDRAFDSWWLEIMVLVTG